MAITPEDIEVDIEALRAYSEFELENLLAKISFAKKRVTELKLKLENATTPGKKKEVKYLLDDAERSLRAKLVVGDHHRSVLCDLAQIPSYDIPAICRIVNLAIKPLEERLQRLEEELTECVKR